MKYIVASTAGCAIGPGERVRLTEAQIATRRHALTVIDDKKGEVEPTTQIVFKRGEVLDLPAKFDDLTSYHRSVLEPAGKPKADDKTKNAAAPDPAAANVAAANLGSNAPNPAD